MGSKHRMAEPRRVSRTRLTQHTAQSRANSHHIVGAVSATVATAGVLAGAAVHFTYSGDGAVPDAAQQPVQTSQPLSQKGTLIAVTPDSMTARSPGGFTQTYFITPSTTAVTGDQNASTSSAFAVNDEVVIVATVRNGKAIATAVADRDLAGLNGPPMDSVTAQPVGQLTNERT